MIEKAHLGGVAFPVENLNRIPSPEGAPVVLLVVQPRLGVCRLADQLATELVGGSDRISSYSDWLGGFVLNERQTVHFFGLKSIFSPEDEPAQSDQENPHRCDHGKNLPNSPPENLLPKVSILLICFLDGRYHQLLAAAPGLVNRSPWHPDNLRFGWFFGSLRE